MPRSTSQMPTIDRRPLRLSLARIVEDARQFAAGSSDSVQEQPLRITDKQESMGVRPVERRHPPRDGTQTCA